MTYNVLSGALSLYATTTTTTTAFGKKQILQVSDGFALPLWQYICCQFVLFLTAGSYFNIVTSVKAIPLYVHSRMC